MSTILDALKRSEQERKLNKVPTLLDMPAPQERSRWPIIVVAVIVLLLAALLLWLFVGTKTAQTDPRENVINSEAVSVDSTEDESVDVDSTSDESASSAAINVSVITYSQEPSARFVFINGKMFQEGEFVMAGVMVESIQQDSVVLIERGKRVTHKL